MVNNTTDILTNTLINLITGIKNRGALSDEEILATVSVVCKNPVIPCDALSDRKLGPLESVVLHLKDKQGMTFHEIAVLLNRDDRTIWTSYRKAQRKVAR